MGFACFSSTCVHGLQANRKTHIFITIQYDHKKCDFCAPYFDGFPIKVHILSFFTRPAHSCRHIFCKFDITSVIIDIFSH